MATITFDTLKFVEKLRAAGVPEAQAKAEAEALVEALGAHELATKSDLHEMELRLEGRMMQMSGDIKADLMKWITGMLLAQAAVIAALVKLL